MLNTAVEYLIILASILAVVIIKLLITPPRQPIFNVYRTPSSFYWLKVAFMYIILSLRKLQRYKKPYEFTDEQLEQPQKLSYHEKAVDAIYFNAASAQGDYLVVATARRKEKLVDGFFFLKIASSNLGVLETPKVPSTALYKTEDNDEYTAEGIRLVCVVPMRKWKFTYNGKMKKTEDPTQSYDVSITADWTSDLPYFNFDTDVDPLTMAKTIALEPWSREYFHILENEHQTHYEQFGDLQGKAVIDGKEYLLNMSSSRDHSFGVKRDWSIFHRYALHFVTAENGDRFAVFKISAPVMLSNLTIGYVYCAKDRKLYPVEKCDLELYQHGENGNPPSDYAFSFKAGGRRYTLQLNITDSPYFYISENWESKVIERMCIAEVNGKKGWGIAEWQYRNIAGKEICGNNNKEQ